MDTPTFSLSSDPVLAQQLQYAAEDYLMEDPEIIDFLFARLGKILKQHKYTLAITRRTGEDDDDEVIIYSF